MKTLEEKKNNSLYKNVLSEFFFFSIILKSKLKNETKAK